MYWQDAHTIAFSNNNKAQNIACRESQEIRDVIALLHQQQNKS